MIDLLCWNRVTDYDDWRRVFEAGLPAQEAQGRTLRSIWRDTQEADKVFFVFEVGTVEAARAFLADPECARAGQEAGVTAGEAFVVERIR